MPTPSDPARAPLKHPQTQQVLRYWLAAIRLEEALASRPKARQGHARGAVPSVAAPNPGQDYFKWPLTDRFRRSFVTGSALDRPLDAEASAFFEDYLYSRYRSGDSDGGAEHLLCFPTVHLPRGELAGVLRRSVRLEFQDAEGRVFAVPSRAKRRRKQFPAPPTRVSMQAPEVAEGEWPYFIDTRLLHRQLGLSSEAIDELFATLRSHTQLSAATMLRIVSEALEQDLVDYPGPLRSPVDRPNHPSDPSGQADEPDAAGRLLIATRALLQRQGGRGRAYPVALVVDGSRAKTTFFLQQDITTLLRAQLPGRTQTDTPLGRYLYGADGHNGLGVQRALHGDHGLTESQAAVADAAWGCRFMAAQGPPGTGKTTLIQHICAEFIVRQVEHLVDHGQLGEGPLLIASSNNRAVDNAINPLAQCPDETSGSLPIAIRVGSRRVCEQELGAQLRRAALFLANATAVTPDEREHDYRAALSRFETARKKVDDAYRPRVEAADLQAQRQQLVGELDAMLPGGPSAAPAPADRKQLAAKLGCCRALQARLLDLSELCDASPSLTTLNTVARHYERTKKKQLTEFDQLVTDDLGGLELGLPPQLPASIDPEELLDVWQLATEQALDTIGQLEEQLNAQAAELAQQRKRAALESRLKKLGQVRALPEVDIDDGSRRRLFQAAVLLREAWARRQAEVLSPLVEHMLYAATESRSLRVLAREQPQDYRALQRLFGIWGSTLLSVGNCIPAQPDSVPRLIVDEAGQCHPAHVTSGLLRAKSALILGDVHQLTPVIELSSSEERRALHLAQVRVHLDVLAPYRAHSESTASAQSIADRADGRAMRLLDHFRCQGPIIRISDALCQYGLRVHTPVQHRAQQAPLLSAPVQMVDIHGTQARTGGSFHNELEVAATTWLLQYLLDRDIEPSDIAVITPYRGQLELLRRICIRQSWPIEHSAEMLDMDGPRSTETAGLAIGTVHRLQGGERSIVIFSTVVSRPASLAFLDSRPNLINVAASRAQHHLVCVGSRSVLAQGRLTCQLTRAASPLVLPEASHPHLAPGSDPHNRTKRG